MFTSKHFSGGNCTVTIITIHSSNYNNDRNKYLTMFDLYFCYFNIILPYNRI